MKIKIVETDEAIKVYTPYNKDFVTDLKSNISGCEWDSVEKCWNIPIMAKEALLNQLNTHYGYVPGSRNVIVKITANQDLAGYTESIYFMGIPIARATGWDSGARVCDGITKISGGISSGGSVKNWKTRIDQGSVFQLEISESALVDIDVDDWSIERIETKINKNDLLAEKAKLEKRIAEIEEQLK